MLIIQPTDTDQDADIRDALGDIRKSAEQVSCYCEDLEHAPGRLNLMRLPVSLLPKPAQELDNLLHDNKDMRNFIHKWADEKGVTIELEERHSGPQILWLQGGGVSAKKDRISIFIILRRPKHREGGHDKVATLGEESPSEGLIERPVTEEQFVHSSFKCQVGDIVILEGGERLRPRKEGDVEPRDLCMLVTLHRTRLKECAAGKVKPEE